MGLREFEADEIERQALDAQADALSARDSKSSHSGGNGDDRVEPAPGFLPDVVPVRDSKDPAGPHLLLLCGRVGRIRGRHQGRRPSDRLVSGFEAASRTGALDAPGTAS
jgi:hypothetical protein